MHAHATVIGSGTLNNLMPNQANGKTCIADAPTSPEAGNGLSRRRLFFRTELAASNQVNQSSRTPERDERRYAKSKETEQ
jgi:hypothetical protein